MKEKIRNIRNTALAALAGFSIGYVTSCHKNEISLDDRIRVVGGRKNIEGGFNVELQQLTGYRHNLWISEIQLNPDDSGGYTVDSQTPWHRFINSDRPLNYMYKNKN